VTARARDLISSVALCTYNGAAYVGEQLDSIHAQERQPDELVVCDDASTDTTVSIVREFAGRVRFPVQLHVQPRNVGSRENFACAIRRCQGDVIVLADQDDIWHRDKLRCLLEPLEHDAGLGLVFSDAELIDATGCPLGESLWEAIRFTPGEQAAFAAAHECDVLLRHNVVSGATMAFRSEFRQLVLPVAQAWVHDGWIALLIAAVARCAALPKRLIGYRQHAQQQIGERKRSLYQQYQRGRGKTAEDFAHVASNYAAALTCLAARRDQLRSVALLDALQRKAAHFEAKAQMRTSQAMRLPLIARELVRWNYPRFSSGWRSVAQDLFL
jgi:hypothetical protein